MDHIAPLDLKNLLLDGGELALIDVREQGAFSEAHLLFAVCVPLSRLELLIGGLVPRPATRIVLVDGPGGEGFAERAAGRLAELGYSRLQLLHGGVEAWRAEGLELFSGVNVPSKAFGELVEESCETPRFTAAEVRAMQEGGRDMVIVDSRPCEEYHRMNIPGGIDMPGAELVYRIHDLAPDPQTLVVVNCAGRTRSIIGAQSLINAGIPNPVAALKDGTMGWHLAGFELEHGAERRAKPPGPEGLAKARAAAARVAGRFGVQTVSPQTVAGWRDDADRTTFLLDVRSPEEYAAGHLPGYGNAPGGQLVQATDEYVAVRNARIVLADAEGVRAVMTASWLLQLGWPEVYVLEGGIGDGPLQQGAPEPRISGAISEATISTEDLARALEDPDAGPGIIDLGPSTSYERHHLPGAVWCVRARLSEALEHLSGAARIVLVSPDGLLARLALREARAMDSRCVDALEGGMDRWLAEGRKVASGLEHTVGATDDVWYKPYEHRGAREKFMRDYLTWEVGLVEQIERDGTARFRVLKPADEVD